MIAFAATDPEKAGANLRDLKSLRAMCRGQVTSQAGDLHVDDDGLETKKTTYALTSLQRQTFAHSKDILYYKVADFLNLKFPEICNFRDL